MRLFQFIRCGSPSNLMEPYGARLNGCLLSLVRSETGFFIYFGTFACLCFFTERPGDGPRHPIFIKCNPWWGASLSLGFYNVALDLGIL